MRDLQRKKTETHASVKARSRKPMFTADPPEPYMVAPRRAAALVELKGKVLDLVSDIERADGGLGVRLAKCHACRNLHRGLKRHGVCARPVCVRKCPDDLVLGSKNLKIDGITGDILGSIGYESMP